MRYMKKIVLTGEFESSRKNLRIEISKNRLYKLIKRFAVKKKVK